MASSPVAPRDDGFRKFSFSIWPPFPAFHAICQREGLFRLAPDDFVLIAAEFIAGGPEGLQGVKDGGSKLGAPGAKLLTKWA